MKKFGHLCRICITDSSFYMNIYVHRVNNECIYKLINSIGDLNICLGDGLPEHICSECYKKLLGLLKFKVMCQNGMAALHILKTKYSGDSDSPLVAEPVQVFVDVPTAPVEPSNVVPGEVDPLEDVVKPLDDAWENGQGKRQLEREEQDTAFLHGDSTSEEGSRDVSNLPGGDDQPREFIAYSLQSDVVISNEDEDEKPTLALEAFCCSLENCHRIFDSLDELNHHQRSCHLSDTGTRQFGFGGDRLPSIQDEIQKVSPSEGKSGNMQCGGSLRDNQLKPSKRKWSTMGDAHNKQMTTTLADGKGLRSAQSTLEYAGDRFLSDSNISLFGDSSLQFEPPDDTGAVVKVENAEDAEQVSYVDCKFFCNQCSLTFEEELSLRKHISEKHSKCNGVYACGGKGEQSFEADEKMDTHITTQGVHDLPLTHKDHVGRQLGKISLAHDRGSIFFHQGQAKAKATLKMGKNCGQKVNSVCLVDHIGTQAARIYGEGTICNQRFASKNFSEAHNVTQSGKSSLRCDVCGRLFEGNEDVHLGGSRGGTTRICEPCVEKSKPASGVNDRCKNLRRHQCRTCGQTYTMKSTLKRHERVHTGERPYVCGICCRTYTRSEYLRDHMKSHDLTVVAQSAR